MLPLLFTLALSAPQAPPDGVYHYVSSLNGTRIGSTAITVTRNPSGGILLSESGEANLNGQSGSIKDTLTLSPTLALSQYQALASLADSKNLKATLTFDGSQAQQTGDVTKTYTLSAKAKHFILTDFGPFTGYFVLPAQMQAWSDPPVMAIVPVYAQGIPVSLDPALKPDRPSGVPAADTQISIASPIQLTIWYDPATLVVDRVQIPSEGLDVTRTP